MSSLLTVNLFKSTKKPKYRFKLPMERWNEKKGCMTGVNGNAKQVNDYITHSRFRLGEIFHEMLKSGNVNLETLAEWFLSKESDNRTLLQLVGQHNKDFEARIGTDYTFSTFEKYDILRRKLEKFMPEVYHTYYVEVRQSHILINICLVQ